MITDQLAVSSVLFLSELLKHSDAAFLFCRGHGCAQLTVGLSSCIAATGIDMPLRPV